MSSIESRVFDIVDELSETHPSMMIVLARALRDAGYLDTLSQCCVEPTWDGDIVSKNDRNFLIKKGFLVHVAYKGRDGYTAATSKGLQMYQQICKLHI